MKVKSFATFPLEIEADAVHLLSTSGDNRMCSPTSNSRSLSFKLWNFMTIRLTDHGK